MITADLTGEAAMYGGLEITLTPSQIAFDFINASLKIFTFGLEVGSWILKLKIPCMN